MKKVFSWDCESVNLWGRTFAIGAVIYEDGIEVKRFFARCPIKKEDPENPLPPIEQLDPWVAENVLPQMDELEITHVSYEAMLKAFASFYMENKDDADIIFHMGIPVESRVILDMYDMGYIGMWDGAYPWMDIVGCLKQAGADCTSVDTYNKVHGIMVPQPEAGGTHNPLYDSRAAALCYMHLSGK